MKIGTVITIFEKGWQELFQPLLAHDFDHFELLPENSQVYTIKELQDYLQGREVILHAPFIQSNFISQDKLFRQAAKEYLLKELKPLVEAFDPAVITTHLGSFPFIYPDHDFSEFQQLQKEIPACVMENMPGDDNLWRKSYPSTEEECDYVLTTLNGKMTFDVGHFMKQDLDVYRLVEKYLPQIVDIHLHDFVEGKDHHPLGTGSLDVERFVKILLKHNYQHYLTIELHHDNVEGMIKSHQLVKSFL